MYRAISICLLASLIGCGGATDSTDPFTEGVIIPGTTTELTVTVGQQSRSYLLHDIQSSVQGATASPLVILLHGSGLTSAEMRAMSGMDSLAEVRHFLVAYPQGTGSPSDWNAGNCCGDPVDQDTDDIAFLKAVIADISSKLLVDPKRIYVGGFSDGARMTYRVACEMAGQIAAVASVSGSLVTSGCAPSRKMPVIAFHGTSDRSVLYDEPPASPYLNNRPTGAAVMPPAVHYWMSFDLCKTITALQITSATTRNACAGCSADVVFYSTNGGQHEWPTVPDYGISASVLMVDFFKAHALP